MKSKCALLLSCVWLCAFGGAAYAQGMVDNDYPVERFRLAGDVAGVLDVEWGAVPAHMVIDVGLWVGFADDPLNLYRMEDGDRTRVGNLVSGRFGGSLVGSIGLRERFQLGLAVPLILSQQQDLGDAGGAETASSFGLGDLRLTPKVQILKQAKAQVDVAVMLGFTVPTSSSSDFMGDSGAVFQPEIAVSREMSSGVRTALNLGYRLRSRVAALDLVVDDELFAHIGAGYRFAARGGPPAEVDLTFAVATGANDIFGSFNRNYAETKLGGSYDIKGPVILFAATGVGMAEGFGTPDWRILAGLRFRRDVEAEVPAPVIPTRVAEKEPPPNPDRDGDGILNEADKCPDEAETVNQYKDSDGCPDEVPDTDGDGMPDTTDECPEMAEDVDQFKDEDGCPDPDNDDDGVLDATDGCPNKAGPLENKGCPDTDRDGDTVIDRKDNCPDEKGLPRYQGCAKKQLVVIQQGKIELLRKVFFRTNKAIIRPKSFRLLNNVAKVLNAHGEIDKVRVEGHTDDRGRDAYNLELSQRRAESVVAYLVKRGVALERLEAVGYGETKPIANNKRKKGRAENRRVEFTILGDTEGTIEKRDDGPTDDTID